MAVKSANVYARIEPEVKEQAETILAALGVPASNAITMFYKQIILHGGLPFRVSLPPRATDMSRMSEAELDAALEKGLDDVGAGRMRPAREVFADLRRDFGLCSTK